MDDLVAWLRHQIDEDERVARATAEGGRWRYEDGDSVGAWTLYDERWNIASMTTYDTESYNYAERLPAFRPPTYIDPDAVGAHIARHDPARVLAEVAAKRAILNLYQQAWGEHQSWLEDVGGDTFGRADEVRGRVESLRETMRLLAQPYADREGFREEWRV